MRYKVQTPGKYIVKGDEKLMVSDNTFYQAGEIDGYKSKSHRMIVTNIDTREKTVLFPGQVIDLGIVQDTVQDTADVSKMTKAELKALMPDKQFDSKVTKAQLLEAYHGR